MLFLNSFNGHKRKVSLVGEGMLRSKEHSLAHIFLIFVRLGRAGIDGNLLSAG